MYTSQRSIPHNHMRHRVTSILGGGLTATLRGLRATIGFWVYLNSEKIYISLTIFGKLSPNQYHSTPMRPNIPNFFLTTHPNFGK